MRAARTWILLCVAVISVSSLAFSAVVGNADETAGNSLSVVKISTTNVAPGGSSLEVLSEDISWSTYYHIDATQQLPWMRYGVVLDLGEPGACDDKSVESPVVIRVNDGTYVMWYRGQTFNDKTGRIMRAVSSDGINWIKTGMVMEPTEDYEGNKIDPMTVIFEDGVYKMWYGAAGYGGCACYATSQDGISWTKEPGNPVLKKTSGSWDSRGAGGQHCVMREENIYKMYYKGYGHDYPSWTFYGLAESNDGINWTKKGKVISPQPELGETTNFKNLFAFRVGDSYCIMHTMADYLHLFLLSSSDGESWSKNGVVFRRGGTREDWDIKWATSPCLLLDNGVIRMWYEGGDPEGRVRTLYAEVAADYFLKICQKTTAHLEPPFNGNQR